MSMKPSTKISFQWISKHYWGHRNAHTRHLLSSFIRHVSPTTRIKCEVMKIITTGWPHFLETKFPEFSLRFPVDFLNFSMSYSRGKFEGMHFVGDHIPYFSFRFS